MVAENSLIDRESSIWQAEAKGGTTLEQKPPKLQVTHFFRRSPEHWAWIPLVMVTRLVRDDDQENAVYFFGFEIHRPLSAADIQARENSGVIQRLAVPWEITPDQGLWLLPDGIVWRALDIDPIGDGNKTQVATVIGLRVTHFVRGVPEEKGWIPIVPVTQITEGAKESPYFFGLEIRRPLSAENIQARVVNGTVKRLECSYPFRSGLGLWLTPEEEVWLASAEDPIADQTRLKIATNT